jgi:2-polyprenyl-6-methoxyphenol hydroxylase-like FAD-dependent oxidoreductase
VDVGIVGCGFAGAAAALFLVRAGHRVTVYEAVAEPGAVGAGIVLQPTGMLVLAELGLLEQALERGARLDRLLCVNQTKRTIVDLAYSDLGRGLFGLGLHRGVLFSILHRAVAASAAEIVLGCFVENVHRDGAKTFVVDRAGERHGPHDLIVVADGARSELRHLTRASVREYPWGALWFVARDPERIYRDTLFQVVRSTTQLLGFLPTGIGPNGEGQVVSLFWSVRTDAVSDWRSGYDAWREHLLAEDERCAFILDQIAGPDDLLISKYQDVVMYPWHVDNVLFIGDAGHATSPQLGQGTNLALCDAMVLGSVLDGDLEASLWRYARERRAHLSYYQLASRWLTPLFQSDYRRLAPFRDLLLPILAKLPFVNGAMVRSMAGVKRGVIRPSLPVAPYRAMLQSRFS